MNDFAAEVVANILQQFSPAALLAIIVINLFTEVLKRIRTPERHTHLVRETLAFCAAMAVMTGWAFFALALPVGVAQVENLNAASAWLFLIGLLLYLVGAFPLGWAMLELLFGAQETNLLDRHELARRRRPVFVYAYLFKVGIALIALALMAFPALAAILPGAPVDRIVLMRYTVVALLLADTVCYGWVLVAE
jgi:hypothetical protein